MMFTPSRLISMCSAMMIVKVTKIACRENGTPENQRFRSDVVKIAAP